MSTLTPLDLKMDLGTPGPTTKPTSSMISSLKSKFGHKTTAYKTAGTSAFSLDKVFVILKDFLQPDTTLSLESASQSIVDLMPENAPLSDEVWSFGDVCFELAEQIPYHHQSQLKFARLLEVISQSAKISQQATSSKGRAEIYRYQRLKEAMRDALDGPEEENPGAWVNFNACIANLHEYRIIPTSPLYSIWALRDACEESHEKGSIRDANILAAAQWILWNGLSLFKQVLFLGDVSANDMQMWTPGPLYNGKPLLSLSRWHFWRDGFRAVAVEDGASKECKRVSEKVVNIMDSLENNLMF